MRLHFVNWPQNGYDCGPIACQVTQHLLKEGLSLTKDGRWIKPLLHCCHPLRVKLAETLYHTICQGVKRFKQESRVLLEEHMDCEANEEYLAEFRESLAGTSRSDLVRVIKSMKRAMHKCHQCQVMAQRDPPDPPQVTNQNRRPRAEVEPEEAVDSQPLGEGNAGDEMPWEPVPARLVRVQQWNQASLGCWDDTLGQRRRHLCLEVPERF
jgi:hypothetical protein